MFYVAKTKECKGKNKKNNKKTTFVLSSSLRIPDPSLLGDPWTSLVAQRVKRLSTMQETRVRALGWEDHLEKVKWQSTPVLLPGKSHGQRSLVGYSLRGHKESDMTERLHFHFTFRNQHQYHLLMDSPNGPVSKTPHSPKFDPSSGN